MTLDAQTLDSVIRELQPLIGARIQRVDVVADKELVIELRCPGRTLRLLLSARPGAGRVHLVPQRPARLIPGGGLQSLLRRRLVGRIMVGLEVHGKTVWVDVPDARLQVQLEGGRSAIWVSPPVERALAQDASVVVPDMFPTSEAIAARYTTMLPADSKRYVVDSLLKGLKGKRKKLKRLRSKVMGDIERLERLAADGARGELLKPVLHSLARGARTVEVTDWQTGLPCTIELDPVLSGKENMQRFFDRAKKGRRGLPKAKARLAQVDASMAAIEKEVDDIKSASPERLIQMTEAMKSGPEPGGPSAGPSRQSAKVAPRPVDRWARRFESAEGTEIRVGRGAKENDRLTFAASRGHDIWLHARGTQGAHVVLRNEKNAQPNLEDLLDAAHLAVHYSSARNDSKVEVIYTEARHVKKTKGAPAGRVGITKSKTMLVSVESDRLDRLLGRQISSDSAAPSRPQDYSAGTK